VSPPPPPCFLLQPPASLRTTTIRPLAFPYFYLCDRQHPVETAAICCGLPDYSAHLTSRPSNRFQPQFIPTLSSSLRAFRSRHSLRRRTPTEPKHLPPQSTYIARPGLKRRRYPDSEDRWRQGLTRGRRFKRWFYIHHLHSWLR
jgi:hypothetical protein